MRWGEWARGRYGRSPPRGCPPLSPSWSPGPLVLFIHSVAQRLKSTDGEINQTKIASPSQLRLSHYPSSCLLGEAPVDVLTEELSILWAIDHSIHSRFQTSFR